MRFWLDRGVDGFRLDTVNFYFHDKLLRDDPADFRRKDVPEWNPYNMQYHIFSKNQPENLAFLERMRKLLDEYEARAMVGEIGESHHAIRMMGEYTTGRRLHKAYSFEMLDDAFTAAHFRRQIEEFFAGAPGGWPCWAFSNHDVVRHVSRWEKHCVGPRGAGQAGAGAAAVAAGLDLHLSGRGAGPDRDRTGVPRADRSAGQAVLAGEQGPRRLPHADGLGRRRANSGFSTGKPWLPIKATQAERHVAGQTGRQNSVLEIYRRMLRLRRETKALRSGRTVFFDTSEPVLAFTRGDKVLCLFDLSPETHAKWCGAGEAVISQGVERRGDRLTLHPNGFALMGIAGEAAVTDRP